MAEIPRIAGPWRELYVPRSGGDYINDHTLVRADDGTWHLFGITSPEGKPSHERHFAHGSGPSLAAPLEHRGIVLDDGVRAWAPAAVRGDDGTWHMLYGPAPTRHAITSDLGSGEWWDSPVEIVGAPLFALHRDHMVLRLDEDTWLMYGTGRQHGSSSISVFVSNDLCQWRYVQQAVRSDRTAPLNPAWGALESPFVVRRGATFHLFTTYTDCRAENYHQTLVLSSTNPYDFGRLTAASWEDTVDTVVHAHAPEVVQDPGSGEWFITSCGWAGDGAHQEGGVAIASLAWD